MLIGLLMSPGGSSNAEGGYSPSASPPWGSSLGPWILQLCAGSAARAVDTLAESPHAIAMSSTAASARIGVRRTQPSAPAAREPTRDPLASIPMDAVPAVPPC